MNMFLISLLFVTLTCSTKDINTLKLNSVFSAIGSFSDTLIKENEKHNQSFLNIATQDRSRLATQDQVNRFRALVNAARPNKCMYRPADKVPESNDIVVLHSEQNGIENLKRFFKYGIENLKSIFESTHAPTWFANLNQEDKTNIVALLSQGIKHYGSFSQDVKQDLITQFQIDDFQAEELYKFVYHSPNRSIAFIILSAIALFGSLPVESLLTGFIMTGPLSLCLISNTIDIVSIALSHAFLPRYRNRNRELTKQKKKCNNSFDYYGIYFFNNFSIHHIRTHA